MRHNIPEDITSLDIESIDFNNKDIVKFLILKLLDTIEQLAQTNHQQYEEIQRLKDEINRLKGEKKAYVERRFNSLFSTKTG